METILKTSFGEFKIKSKFIGNKIAPWSKDDKNQNENYHKITVSHNGKRLSFDFWASIAQPELNSENDLHHAFYCFLSDAVSAKDSFENFCSEFGYDSDSRTAERIYKACEKSCAKLERIFDGDVYDLINEVQEITNA